MSFSAANLSRVKLVKNSNYQRNGLKSYVHLLRKYNIKPTLDGPYSNPSGTVVKAATSGQTGEVPAEDIQNDTEYLASVGIGTPAQNLLLDFDTGSADLWVWSTQLSASLQSQGTSAGHTIFDSSKSSTWKPSSGETWQIQYGDGSTASGDVGTDVLNVGGLVIEGQAIEEAEKLSASFQQGSGDGLLGLAFGSINTVKPKPVQTPVENMISQQDIPQTAELFTAYLGSSKNASDTSFYTFGYIDQEVVTASGGEIQYTDVDNSQGFWMFPSTTAQVNGKAVNAAGNTAIADTGTTLALVSDALCKAIYAAIPGSKLDQQQQGYVFPSSTATGQLPTVQVAVGSNLFTIEKEYLAFADAGNGMVYGGIQSRGSLTFDILGDVFLKSVYAVFDQGNTRFGCVQRTAQTASS